MVYRGPASSLSAPDKEETKSIIFAPEKSAFCFDVRHANGGSSIDLYIGEEDWRTVLESLAKSSSRLKQLIQRVAVAIQEERKTQS